MINNEKCHQSYVNGNNRSQNFSMNNANFLSLEKQQEIINPELFSDLNFELKSLNESEIKTIKKKAFSSNKSTSLNYSASFGTQSLSKKTIKSQLSLSSIKNDLLGKKRKKIMTSEEIELDKIRKEKKEIEKQKKMNTKFYQRSKNYKPFSITPSPLTLIKPFNLSCSSTTQYLKRRMTSTNYEIEKINAKIKKKLEEKFEEFGKQNKEDDDKEKNLSQLNQLNNNYITINHMDINKNLEDKNEDKTSFTYRLNKYCEMTKELLMKQEKMESDSNKK